MYRDKFRLGLHKPFFLAALVGGLSTWHRHTASEEAKLKVLAAT